MWSGLLPPGLTESDVSGAEEEPEPPASISTRVSESCVTKFLDLQKKRRELEAKARRRARRQRRGKCQLTGADSTQKHTSPAPERTAALDTLQKYYGIHDHLDPPVCKKILKKSRLEESLDEALNRGDIEEAEELSDKLATREAAVKITKAVSCHKYMKAKEEQGPSQESQGKRKPMAWGFEAKKRWETKSNMGYM